MAKTSMSLTQEQIGVRLKKNMSIIAGIFVLAMSIIHPLIINNHYYNITNTKLYTYITIFCVTVFMLVCVMLYALMQGYVPQLTIKERIKRVWPHEWALLAYLFFALISACFASYPDVAWTGASNRNEGFWMQLVFVGTVLIMGRLYKPKARDMLIFCGIAALVSVYGILQYFGLDPLDLQDAATRSGGVVARGIHNMYLSTMSNKNVFSTYLVLALALSTVMFAQHTGALKWAFLPCSLITFYMLLCASTDSGYVGIVAAFILCFALIAKGRKDAARFLLLFACFCLLFYLYNWLFPEANYEGVLFDYAPLAPLMPWLAGIAALIAAVLYIAPLPATSRAMQRTWHIIWIAIVLLIIIVALIALPALAERTQTPLLVQANELLHGELSDTAGSGRGYIWKKSIDFFKERPLIGHGTDNYLYVSYNRLHEELVTMGLPDFDKAHNEYLQVMVNQGLFGLITLLAFYGLSLWRARKARHLPMGVAVYTALIGFLVQAFFNFSSPFASPLVWMLWGILAALTREIPPESQQQPKP